MTMSRKLRSQAKAIEPTAPVPPTMCVQAVIVPARGLLTVRPDHPLWHDDLASVSVPLYGAIVCMFPSGEVSDERIAALKAKLEGAGAKVRVMPRAASEAVVATAKGNIVEGADTRTVREIAMELVDAANTDDREALRDIVNTALDAEGA
jgi:hypothetical protein